MIISEAVIHEQVCNYLRMQYPDVLFRSDFAAGIKLTIGQARKHKRMQQGRAWPDLFIAQSAKGFHGLFIELKARPIMKRDGTTFLKDLHVQEQKLMLDKLQYKGYKAEFAVGFDQAKQLIDEFLLA